MNQQTEIKPKPWLLVTAWRAGERVESREMEDKNLKSTGRTIGPYGKFAFQFL